MLAWKCMAKFCQRVPGHRTFEQPAHRPPQSDGHLGDAQPLTAILRKPLQVDVVDPHHLPAVHIDNLPVQHILLEEKQVFISAKGLKLGVLAQFEGSGRRLQYILHRNQPGSLPRLEKQSCHIARGRSGGHRDVFQAALYAALPVRDQRTEQERKAGVRGVLFVHRRPVAV